MRVRRPLTCPTEQRGTSYESGFGDVGSSTLKQGNLSRKRWGWGP